MNLYRESKISLNHVKQGKLLIFTGILLLILVIDPVISEIPAKIAVFRSSKAFEVLLTALTAGICEELLFRGLLFNICIEALSKSKYAFVWTSIITAVAFSALHIINISHQSLLSTFGQMVIVFGSGLVWSYVRILSNGISVNILLHVWQDLNVQIVANNVGNSHIKQIIPVVIIESLFTLLCVFLYNRKYNQQFR